MAMDRARGRVDAETAQTFDEAIDRGREWIEGLQSRNGGWGAFDADNNYDYLNYIPFADHGALLDPPTADVSARCLSMLGQLGQKASTSEIGAQGLEYLFAVQEADGSWYGRWGMNYIYGTWSSLSAHQRGRRRTLSSRGSQGGRLARLDPERRRRLGRERREL